MSDIREFDGIAPSFADQVYLDPACCVIGDVQIGERSSVWPGVVIRGDVQAIRIGTETNVQDNSVLHNSHDGPFMPGGSPLIVGNGVTVGHKVILHGCEIGDYCLIGMGAIIMDKAVMQDEVILGAGSLVPGGKILQSGHLYTGSPAKMVRPLTEREREYLRYSAAHYVRLAGKHQRHHQADC